MALSSELPARKRAARTPLLCRLLTGCWRAYIAWRTRRGTLAALRELDGRLLRDVGLTRADQLRGRPQRRPYGRCATGDRGGR